ncbi:putative DSBA-like thioredoxin domain, Thioredoxin-like superfamily [Helianthus annuus]|uniref:DSBA-like thioredoxin domain, Thioredoxin-like superfamily n=2 Tax=Helianthus annuus TaxID=4232 RepID=A0A9K3JZI8_HELAN|nr:putative DSBA-like thioredoxin domain, Thioredoxin-like superfamily [Helianthus annuus]KAJ0581689.1 putative DSBA-like thioredoxin domain, Thioredoxin-like superfamily [Helianthus annuus]KAJ0597648.1 putative DSBA-like thioredoxin domain, Thioredoxin-like superfamily [Helianthus annuus]KAJ0758298.1 putative DSBA-like thioredoxin domain, Thioredoxin-like superfamily [Helianthus annuus]KAJ0761958.1 putative DSBA-like thioredoxin domain, Thioredoxin-like superfamily [Helianthus annuus]
MLLLLLSGSSLDSQRLILFVGKQGLDKQHNLVEELMNGYFTQGKFIGDKDFLVESATKVGLEEAVEFLQDPNNGLQEECKCTLNVMKTRKKSTHIIVRLCYKLGTFYCELVLWLMKNLGSTQPTFRVSPIMW